MKAIMEALQAEEVILFIDEFTPLRARVRPRGARWTHQPPQARSETGARAASAHPPTRLWASLGATEHSRDVSNASWRADGR